jgi:hypothetical protein
MDSRVRLALRAAAFAPLLAIVCLSVCGAGTRGRRADFAKSEHPTFESDRASLSLTSIQLALETSRVEVALAPNQVVPCPSLTPRRTVNYHRVYTPIGRYPNASV